MTEDGARPLRKNTGFSWGRSQHAWECTWIRATRGLGDRCSNPQEGPALESLPAVALRGGGFKASRGEEWVQTDKVAQEENEP